MRDSTPSGVAGPYRGDIEGLRAVAVALVVAYHAFPRLLPGGFIGVDVFFVISGFLITRLIWGALLTDSFSIVVFYRRRVRRIVPALLLLLVSCALIGWYVLLPGELRWLGQSLAWCAPFVANVFFARTGSYFDVATELNPLLHLWSLGVEEQFYLLWPLMLWAAYRFGAARPLLMGVLGASMAFSVWGIWHAPGARFYMLSTRAWELGVGAALVLLPARGRFRLRGSALGLTMIIAAALLLDSERAFPGAWALLPACGAALLIAADPGNAVNRLFLASAPMMSLGRISYPLYLWHWPALAFTRIVLGRPPSVPIACAAVAFSILAASLTHLYLEAPIRAGRWPRAAVPTLLAGLASITVLGWSLHARHLNGRLVGPQIAVLDQAIDDWHYPGGFNFGRSSAFKTLDAASHQSRTVLFVGDSHIEQYWPRVKYLIDSQPDASRSARFATYVGCPPMPGINSPRRGWSCDGFIRYALQQAQGSDVDSVVFGAFWEVYWLGEYSAEHSRQPIYRVDDPARRTLAPGSADTQRTFEDFERAVAQIVKSGRRVYIVLSNPTSPLFDPVSLMPAAARLMPNPNSHLQLDPQRRALDDRPFAAFVAPVTVRLRQLAARAGAEVIDPAVSLCDGSSCPSITSQGVPLYLDSNHLRPFFARQRAQFLDKILLDIT